MPSEQGATSLDAKNGQRKKQILLNAFDMSTVGHLSPGQWKVSSSSHLVLFQASVDNLSES